METLFKKLIDYRWLSIALVIAITALAASQLPKLQVDNSNEAFFVSGDPTQKRLDQFKETFGNDDFVFILVDVKDAFETKTLKRLAEFTDRLENETPYLLDLTWVGNVEWIEGVPGGIVIEELIPNFDLDPQALKKLRDKATNDPLYRNRLVSENAHSVGILMEFENYPDAGIDPRKEVPPVINKLVDEFSDLETHVVGGPIMDYVLDEKTAVEAPKWMAAALLGMILVLVLTTRSVIGVLVPAATVILSVIWVMGAVSVLGFKLNIFVILVPTLMLCVGIGDTMHVVAEFKQNMLQGMNRKTALLHTLDLVSKPILLTTITTAIGFLAFTFVDLVPLVELGIQAATGVFVAFVLTYLFAVPVLSFGKHQIAETKQSKTDLFDRLLERCVSSVSNNKLLYGLGFAIVTAIALIGVTKIEIETNTVQDLPKHNEMRQAFNYVDENMGGSMSMEFVIDTGKENGIKNQELLRKVERLQAFLDQHPMVTQTSSVLDQIKQMNRAIHENDQKFYTLPPNTNQFAEYLLLYESGGGDQLEKYMGFTYDQMRVQARTKSIALADTEALSKDVSEFVSTEFGDEVNIYSTGSLVMFQRIADLVRVGQGRSFMFAFVAIALIMIFTLRSVQLGLIAMIPNVIPVAFALGAMGWFGAQLNIMGLVLAPMIIGVAVDDTVHFFVRYRRYFDEVHDYDLAYKKTMHTVGRPLLFTTLVLIAGFAGFSISEFAGARNFSWASGVAFLSAILAEFLLVPVLLAWLKPMGPAKQQSEANSVLGGQNA